LGIALHAPSSKPTTERAQHPTGKARQHVMVLFCLGRAPRKEASYWHAMHALITPRLPF